MPKLQLPPGPTTHSARPHADAVALRRKSPGSRAGRSSPDCGRATLRRVLWIHERLGNEHTATAISLARELEVSERTIKRDLEFMRDQLGAPIEWDPSAHTYHYTRDCDILPLLRLDAGEALALALAGRTFAAWHGSPLGRSLTAALGKIAGVVGGAVSLPVSEVNRLVFQPDDTPGADEELRYFATTLEAIRRQRVLRLRYRKPGARSDETRSVHPLHLAHLDHRWVLVAHDPARAAPRNFLLQRIRHATATAAIFDPPAGFDLQAYLRGSLGRFTGDRDIEVRLVFSAALAPYLRERPWHSSQTLRDRPDGHVEATLRLNNLIDIQRRILACGRHVEVLAPAELRATIRAEAEALATRHRGQPGKSADNEELTKG